MQLTLVECERDGRTLYARAGEDDVKVLDRAEVSAIALPAPATRAIDSLRPADSYRDESRTCRLAVRLDEVSPPIWRRLEVHASLRLEKLHEVIQAAFGWTNSHLHVFEVGDERIGVGLSQDRAALAAPSQGPPPAPP